MEDVTKNSYFCSRHEALKVQTAKSCCDEEPLFCSYGESAKNSPQNLPLHNVINQCWTVSTTTHNMVKKSMQT